MKCVLGVLLAACVACSTTVSPSQTVEYGMRSVEAPSRLESDEATIAGMLRNDFTIEDTLKTLGVVQGSFSQWQITFPNNVHPDVTVGTPPDPGSTNCADSPPMAMTIGCLWSEDPSTVCRIVVNVPSTPGAGWFGGTWVFEKKCDGNPIAQYTPAGLVVDYDWCWHLR